MEEVLMMRIFFSLALVGLLSFFAHLCNVLLLEPERLRSRLRRQGIRGPPPSILLGNIPQIKLMLSTVPKDPAKEHMGHDCSSTLFPYFKQWTKQYGQLFMFSLGKLQLLYVTDPNVVKAIKVNASLDLGKPAYLQKDRGALLGKGIITTNGAMWIHQRKTIAPELYMDKVKGMLNLMLESGSTLVKSWESRIENEGGLSDIRVDEDVRRYTSYIISKTLFGSSYSEKVEIFPKFSALIEALRSPTLLNGVPGMRYLPTKKNREIWRMERDIQSIIINIAKERTGAESEKDMLQMIIEGANKGDLDPAMADQFVVDNCKNIHVAACEVTAIVAIWGLMLLASHPEWQARARAEVLEICVGCLPDANMLGKMKVLNMVIQEVLRLYPGVGFVSRETLQDMKLGDVCVPKGVAIWIWLIALHRDPEIWGPDAHDFNPERFANGISGACKFPQGYIPFGLGSRICPGQSLAIAELKVLFALILSKFSFSLSPKYRHSPVFGLLLEPEYGVDLLVRMI